MYKVNEDVKNYLIYMYCTCAVHCLCSFFLEDVHVQCMYSTRGYMYMLNVNVVSLYSFKFILG